MRGAMQLLHRTTGRRAVHLNSPESRHRPFCGCNDQRAAVSSKKLYDAFLRDASLISATWTASAAHRRRQTKKGDPSYLSTGLTAGAREALNKSWRCSAPRLGIQCEKESTAIAVAMASISDEAMRPKRGCDACRGLVQRFLSPLCGPASFVATERRWRKRRAEIGAR